jgi:hypothetical protein
MDHKKISEEEALTKKQSGNLKRVRRLVYAQRAFKNVIAMIDFILLQDLSKEWQWYSVATTGFCTEYMRPFTENEGIGPLPDVYTKFEDESLRTLHRMIEQGRNWIFAHHDMKNAPSLLPAGNIEFFNKITVRLSAGSAPGIILAQCATKPMKFPEQNLRGVIALCKFQNSRINTEVRDALKSLRIPGKPYPMGEYVLGKTYP